MKFTEWIEKQSNYGIFNPPMTSQIAVNLLADYLLGEDWVCVDPISTEQINTQIVYEILMKYSRKFRKEVKKYKKERWNDLSIR